MIDSVYNDNFNSGAFTIEEKRSFDTAIEITTDTVIAIATAIEIETLIQASPSFI